LADERVDAGEVRMGIHEGGTVAKRGR
jgi:hypothetical protein